jgi:hypothetical protein
VSSGSPAKRPVNQVIYDALTVLQHRGQDAAGIVTVDDENRLHTCRSNGLVRDVFQQSDMLDLVGHMGLGHVRYPTAGCSSGSEAQPFYVNSPYGICLAHNGNLTNLVELTHALMREELRHLHTGLRFRSAAERVCPGTGEAGPADDRAGRHLRRSQPHPRTLPWKLRGGGADHRPRPGGLPRSVRAATAGAR